MSGVKMEFEKLSFKEKKVFGLNGYNRLDSHADAKTLVGRDSRILRILGLRADLGI